MRLYGSLLLPFLSHLDRPRSWNHARARGLWQNRPSAGAFRALLGAPRLGAQRVLVHGTQLVDSLPLAHPVRVEFLSFLFILLSPTVEFLLAVLLFPEPLEHGTDFKQHFYSNHRWFFVLAALLPPLDAADTLLKGYAHFAAQGTIYPVTIVSIFALTLLAATTDDERFHKFFALFFLVYILIFIGINLRTLT